MLIKFSDRPTTTAIDCPRVTVVTGYTALPPPFTVLMFLNVAWCLSIVAVVSGLPLFSSLVGSVVWCRCDGYG